MVQHLKKGDLQPPVKKGLLRLYSMRFCAFAHRVHLVLDTKKIPYDPVFINLYDKPEWMFNKSEGAKVPVIEFDDGKLLSESLLLADYLDEAYPEPALYPSDPRAKAEDRMLLEKFGPVIGAFYKIIFDDNGLNEENFGAFIKSLEIYENALAKRGTIFFGGEKPGMLDLMIWPWLERVPPLAVMGGDSYKLPPKFTKLISWSAAMTADENVKIYSLTPQVHAKFLGSRKTDKYDFDYSVE